MEVKLLMFHFISNNCQKHFPFSVIFVALVLTFLHYFIAIKAIFLLFSYVFILIRVARRLGETYPVPIIIFVVVVVI